MIKKVALILLFSYTFAIPSQLDGERRGFLLGGGLGFGAYGSVYTTYDINIGLIVPFCLDTRIGYNFADRVDMTLSSKFDITYPYYTPIVNSSHSGEFLFYVRNRAPSWFFTLSTGVSLLFYPFSSDWNRHYAEKGFSAGFGTGYELCNHISILMEHQFMREVHRGNATRYSSYIPTDVVTKVVHIVYGVRLSLRYTFY